MNVESWGKARVARAQGILRRTFDNRREVPSTDSYFRAYKPSTLPLLTSYRKIYKTYQLDKKMKHNLNYAIRAATVLLTTPLEKNSDAEAVLITVNFSESFTKRLEAMKSPVSYYGKRLKEYLKSLNVTDFFYVIEEGKRRQNQVGRRLHAHIVLRTQKHNENELKEILQNPNEVYFDEWGNAEHRCVDVEWGYEVKMFGDYISKDDVELLEMEINDYPEQTAWKLPTLFQRSHGISFVKPMLGINVGLADYLSKQLHVQLLQRSQRNYYISRSLVKRMKSYVAEIIEHNQIAMGLKPKAKS
ncbi:hypothetical protein [Thalassotalea sp. G2M2-11]|uniref:hypothetical protein n=1 Tax=Thalassotalea sp. G2M2-11 TaxID=2787627 RepID=UPI0019CF5FFA|nr:hypothetical protein [Thalassotalea sp. G2M2-11]